MNIRIKSTEQSLIFKEVRAQRFHPSTFNIRYSAVRFSLFGNSESHTRGSKVTLNAEPSNLTSISCFIFPVYPGQVEIKK